VKINANIDGQYCNPDQHSATAAARRPMQTTAYFLSLYSVASCRAHPMD
jgi:hypothetical protein